MLPKKVFRVDDWKFQTETKKKSIKYIKLIELQQCASWLGWMV